MTDETLRGNARDELVASLIRSLAGRVERGEVANFQLKWDGHDSFESRIGERVVVTPIRYVDIDGKPVP